MPPKSSKKKAAGKAKENPRGSRMTTSTTFPTTVQSFGQIASYDLSKLLHKLNPVTMDIADTRDKPYHKLFGALYWATGLLKNAKIYSSDKEVNEKEVCKKHAHLGYPLNGLDLEQAYAKTCEACLDP
eukprot:5302735-Karenia_brevis.AAC.1